MTMTVLPYTATKCISKTHGYDKTLQAVDTSLERLGVGVCHQGTHPKDG